MLSTTAQSRVSSVLIIIYVPVITFVTAMILYTSIGTLLIHQDFELPVSPFRLSATSRKANRFDSSKPTVKSRLTRLRRKRRMGKATRPSTSSRADRGLPSDREMIRRRLKMLLNHKGFGEGTPRHVHAVVSLVGFFAMLATFVGSILQQSMYDAGSTVSNEEENGFIFFIRNDDNIAHYSDEEEIDGDRANGPDRERVFDVVRVLD